MGQSTSIFERILGQSRPLWVIVLVCLVFIGLPVAVVYLDGTIDQFFNQDRWRVFLLPPTIILYIWLISPPMSRMGNSVISSIRPLVQLSNEDFDRQISTVSRINPNHEWIAFGIGVAIGIYSILIGDLNREAPGSLVYWLISISLMYGILAWAIFASISSTRINATLHRMPMKIDILDTSPFEVIGRQSLVLALVFIGGITISLLFTFQEADLSSIEFWLVNVLFVLFVIVIFFLSMRPTHQLLTAEKNRHIEPVQKHINLACQELIHRLDQDQNPGSLSADINALQIYEKRLLTARTWPYNTAILRTLFFSVLIPLGSIIVRLAVDILLP